MLNTPYTELGVLLRAVTGAFHMARCGPPEWGYQLLAGHLQAAERSARAACPWAPEFVAAYRLALTEYVHSFGKGGASSHGPVSGSML